MIRILFSVGILLATTSHSLTQSFVRTELPTPLTTPWEIQVGPDSMLWLTESGGKVIRVDPTTGDKVVVYTATDYFGGSPSESNPWCGAPIGSGTLGMALHPDFVNPSNAFIYFMYSYNAGTLSTPQTRFKIARLKWDPQTQTVTQHTDLITGISNGFDHWGGRLLIVSQNGIPYLFVSVGDHGRSEENNPTCYQPQTLNPNNNAQDPTFDNGKIHRYALDGTIPEDNPVAGNSFYTRGHRNPQGLIYNPTTNQLYAVEHGDRTDDEINVLHKGMNYGWKQVKGYHADANFPGESDFIANYVPNPSIPSDQLIEPFYSFCAVSQPTSANASDWCTIAPSDGVFYGSDAIPAWTNSLLIVTLKSGVSTDMEVYQLKLNAMGEMVESTTEAPNPKRFFGSDQELNGRLRDIAVSHDGKSIYLINNGGATPNTDKITVYTFKNEDTVATMNEQFVLYPNPAQHQIQVYTQVDLPCVYAILQVNGAIVRAETDLGPTKSIDISKLSAGIYFMQLRVNNQTYYKRFHKY